MASSRTTLMQSLASNNRYQRATAAIELGKRRIRQALPELRRLTTDSDDIVAIAAMYACWELGEDLISIERIVAALESDSEEDVQQAVETVGAIGEPFVAKLAPLLMQSPDRARLALKLLDEIGGPEARRLVQFMRSDDPDVAALVREILDDWEDAADAVP